MVRRSRAEWPAAVGGSARNCGAERGDGNQSGQGLGGREDAGGDRPAGTGQRAYNAAYISEGSCFLRQHGPASVSAACFGGAGRACAASPPNRLPVAPAVPITVRIYVPGSDAPPVSYLHGCGVLPMWEVSIPTGHLTY